MTTLFSLISELRRYEAYYGKYSHKSYYCLLDICDLLDINTDEIEYNCRENCIKLYELIQFYIPKKERKVE